MQGCGKLKSGRVCCRYAVRASAMQRKLALCSESLHYAVEACAKQCRIAFTKDGKTRVSAASLLTKLEKIVFPQDMAFSFLMRYINHMPLRRY